MSKGAYLLTIVFCSPAYFAMRKKWLACLINSIFYILAVATLVLGIGVFFWLIGMVHAYWDFGMLMREDTLQRQAELIAEKTRTKPGREL